MSASATRRRHVLPADAVPCRSRSRKPTWEMDRSELARVVAEHRGLYTAPGGWLYTPSGRPIAHGYAAFARQLGAALMVGRGVDWSRVSS